MTAPDPPPPCPACGEPTHPRGVNPLLGVALACLGALVVEDAWDGRWDPATGAIHQVFGGALGVGGLLGLLADGAALARGRLPSGYWVEMQRACSRCAWRDRTPPALRVARACLLVATVLAIALRFARAA